MKKFLSILLILILFLGLIPASAIAAEVEVEPISGFTTEPMLASGAYHTLALRYDGTVWAWGQNTSGQLGDGSRIAHFLPTQVPSLENIVSIGAYGASSIAVGADGRLWVWGVDNTGSYNVRPRPFLVRHRNGDYMDNILAVAGHRHALVIRNGHELWARGGGPQGASTPQLGTGTQSANLNAVRPDNNFPLRVFDNVTSVAAGSFHSLAVRRDGSVWAWGLNNHSQLGHDPSIVTEFRFPALIPGLEGGARAVAAGREHSLILMENGTVQAFGANFHGQLGNGTTARMQHTPTQIQNLNNIVALSASIWHSLALRSDGTVWAWGRNAAGELGDGTAIERHTPVQVQNLNNVTAISSGNHHGVALREDGTVWAWGWNSNGQLGTGTTTSAQFPATQVRGPGGTGHLNLRPAGAGGGTPDTGGALPFTDVPATHAFYAAIRHVHEGGIMTGTSATAFSPDTDLSRAQIATILQRLDGSALPPFRPIFNDVVSGRWYSSAVTWAYDAGVVGGVGGGRFAPNTVLSIEQLSAMLHRFAESQGLDVSVPAHVTAPVQTSSWAVQYVRWAVHNNFIPATNPGASATRAQTANFIFLFDLHYGR